MKLKAAWVEYDITPARVEKKWGVSYRTSSHPQQSFFIGLYEEEKIRMFLSTKQFNEWKSGKRKTFVKYLTVQERKDILKKNNKKKDEDISS